MRKRNLFIILSLILLGALSCGKDRADNDKPGKGPLNVRMTVTDGLRNLEKVLRQPGLVLTVENGNEGASYEAVFSINGGSPRTVHDIWDNVPKDLGGEFLSIREYGPISFEGYLVDPSAPQKRVPLDTTLWMAYAPAQREPARIRTEQREETLSAATVFTVGESGTIEVGYAPADTFLPISLIAAEGSPLAIGPGAVNHDGLFQVPFHVEAAGVAVVTLVVENGRDRETLEYHLNCKEADPQDKESEDNE